jgi:1-acyl-sn-glycerol-3-phosphate acyltransferase
MTVEPVLRLHRGLAASRLAGFFLMVAIGIPIQATLLVVWSRGADLFPVWFHKTVLRLIGIKVKVTGTPCRDRPALLVCNHTSYMDIIVLGSLMPLTFIAKREVATWPGFGLLAKLQRTVFVDRTRRTDAGAQRDAIADRLNAGGTLVLFPEGTTNDGNRVLAYTRLDGIPIGRAYRPMIAWYGDMDLGPHLWRLLGMGVITVEVHCAPVRTIAESGGRKALARSCETAIGGAFEGLISGRPSDVR